MGQADSVFNDSGYDQYGNYDPSYDTSYGSDGYGSSIPKPGVSATDVVGYISSLGGLALNAYGTIAGKPVGGTPTTVVNQAPVPNNNNTVLWVIVGLVAATIVGGLLYLIGKKS